MIDRMREPPALSSIAATSPHRRESAGWQRRLLLGLTMTWLVSLPGTGTAGPPTPALCRGTAPIAFCQQTWPRSTQSVQCYDRSGEAPQTPKLDLSPLSCLSQLQTLSLISGEIEFVQTLKLGSLAPLAGLGQLQSLQLEETDVVDIQPLASLTGLRMLSLHHSRIRDVQPLASLTQLEELDLSVSQVRDLRPLRALKRLRKLDLTRCPVEDLSPLAELSQLAWLGFDDSSPAQKAQADALRKRLPTLTIRAGRTH